MDLLFRQADLVRDRYVRIRKRRLQSASTLPARIGERQGQLSPVISLRDRYQAEVRRKATIRVQAELAT
jgi:hypothetical protein